MADRKFIAVPYSNDFVAARREHAPEAKFDGDRKAWSLTAQEAASIIDALEVEKEKATELARLYKQDRSKKAFKHERRARDIGLAVDALRAGIEDDTPEPRATADRLTTQIETADEPIDHAGSIVRRGVRVFFHGRELKGFWVTDDGDFWPAQVGDRPRRQAGQIVPGSDTDTAALKAAIRAIEEADDQIRQKNLPISSRAAKRRSLPRYRGDRP